MIIVHSITRNGRYEDLEVPTMANEINCPDCGDNEYATMSENANDKNGRQSWICLKLNCRSLEGLKEKCGGNIPTTSFKPLKWHEFCEIMGIGDEFYDVKFENIKQSAGKIVYLQKFVKNPYGFILMRGKAGLGKTYCALGICERFIKSSNSCIFITFKEMNDGWLASHPHVMNYASRFKVITLLVIDDFGTDDPSEKFMTFIMDVLNARNQWSNRGTVISTNMNEEKFSLVCGQALTDRIATGMEFEFSEDKSRRPKRIL